MPRQIITLTTDFGLKDHYVAEMKAVILGINRNVDIIDISHGIEKFDIRMGAYILACATRFFPKDTIHVAVVDPKVGTERRSLLIQTKRGFFIGPDNGLLILATRNQGKKHIYEMKNENVVLPKICDTFHGRDIFAPAAAHLAKGANPKEFGPEIFNVVEPSFTKTCKKNSVLISEVLHTDVFGNIITNISEKALKSANIAGYCSVNFKDAELKLKFCKTYANVGRMKTLALIGSHGFLEISINQGDAAETYNVKNGDRITVRSN